MKKAAPAMHDRCRFVSARGERRIGGADRCLLVPRILSTPVQAVAFSASASAPTRLSISRGAEMNGGASWIVSPP